jgi:PKD repeat protein
VNAIGIYPYSSLPDILDLAVNAQDELLVSGNCNTGSCSINGDTDVFINHTYYLFKFNAAGNFVWYETNTNTAGSPWCTADGIAVRNGNEYILGGSTPASAGIFGFGCLQYASPILQTNFITFISELPEWNPVASFTYSVSNDTTYTFTDASTDATSWHWDFGDGDTSNLQNPSHDFTSGGNFTIVLTVHHGVCSSTDTVQIVGVGINEIVAPVSFTLSPNPAATNITLHFNGEELKTVRLKNILGETVAEIENGLREMKMDISTWAEGIYFITVTDKKNNSVTKKVVKM